jgi:hypothetical protein
MMRMWGDRHRDEKQCTCPVGTTAFMFESPSDAMEFFIRFGAYTVSPNSTKKHIDQTSEDK